ncbi:hypothetical protein R5R35_004205 [Gryllus longicercus]|uniref:AN1-type domain-containing protein n=1 Tax=Gryllus longicercus TaxID=2509291 RepID=A0AAN9V7N4_9ORTH
MEFPDLGQHCSEVTCQQLDFLPLKCDACENIFCREHIAYKDHNCSSAYKKDVQVPVCPLCNTPVPLKKGETPDFVVGQHIDNDCQSDPARSKRKVFNNKCSAKGCKVKEVIPVICNKCKLNFCLKHRHEADHQCEGEAGASRRKAMEAALARQKARNGQSFHHQGGGPSGSNSRVLANGPTRSQNNGPFHLQNGGLSHTHKSSQLRSKQRATATDVQGSMSEDEALARALALSMQETSQLQNQPNALSNSNDQITSDFMLAQALAESEQPTTSARSTQNKCAVS